MYLFTFWHKKVEKSEWERKISLIKKAITGLFPTEWREREMFFSGEGNIGNLLTDLLGRKSRKSHAKAMNESAEFFLQKYFAAH